MISYMCYVHLTAVVLPLSVLGVIVVKKYKMLSKIQLEVRTAIKLIDT